MATFRPSSYVASAFRVRIEASVADKSGDSTKSVVTAKVYVEMASGAKDGAWNFQAQGAIGNSSTPWSSSTTGPNTYLNSGESALIKTYTKEYSKTTSTQTVTVYGRVQNTYAWSSSGWSTTQGNMTVPALTSYSVTYNANGGTGAPSAQTKYQGQALTLSSTAPTRTNYTFNGWNTAANGSGDSYAAGGSYTQDKAVILYAQWTLAYVAPTITAFTAFRSNSSGASDPAGTQYMRLSCSWTLDQTGGTNNSCTVKFKNGSTQLASVSETNKTSGTTASTYNSGSATGLPATTAYTLTVEVTDSHGLTTTATAVVGVVFKPFSMRNNGNSAAFFGIAGATWSKILGIYGRMRSIGDNSTGVSIMSTGIENSATDVSTAVDGAPLFLEDKTGTWLTQIRQRFQPSVGQALLIETRRIISSASKYHSIRIGLTTSGKPYVLVSSTESSPNAKQAWFTGIAGWDTLVAGFSGTGSTYKDYTLTGYTELLVVVKYSTTYASSVLVPVAALTTSNTDWYLGGWYAGSTYAAACKMTTTRITPYKVRVDGTEYNGTWTVYAR